ncbi:MAG: cytochrome C [Acidobacteria bacterium]|nr:MAG: cytochrome C [Acidobacteriota bacterium]PYR16413.1 MAG: cytochrome C [Acidobacteriota bacterium]
MTTPGMRVTDLRLKPPSDAGRSVCESSLLAVLVLAIVAGGCGQSAERGREYTPDMTYSVAYDSFAPNPATRNGMTLQTPVRGTIPRGFLPLHYTNTAADAERAGRELSNPYAHVPSAVEQGHRQYETFCQVCHGARGDGDGPIVPLIPNPPAYSSERVRAMPAGRLFHVMTYGSGRMPSYASQIPASDRWLIATFVHTLQTRPEAAQ